MKKLKYGLPGKLFGPYSFVNITEGREEVDHDGSSRNLVEVAVVMEIVQRLHNEWNGCREKLSVAVISPYVAQVTEIERRLGNEYDNFNNFELKVRLIEGFRGHEADVVIMSTVRSNCAESRRSVSDHQSTSFALPKARHCLWLLGNEKALSREDPIWENVLSNAKESKCFFDASEDEGITQIITNVKTKLDELEDLLDEDSLIFKGVKWKVIFSENFVKSFTKLPSTYSKKLVVNLLLKLAKGWRPKRTKADVVLSSMRIAKQYKVEGRYIICTNDIGKILGYATQVLKVWDILNLQEVPALVSKLDKIYGVFTDNFLLCCKAKCLEGGLEVPRRYNSFNFARYKGISDAESTSTLEVATEGISCAENAKVNESLLLMKFYSLSSRVVSHLLSASDGTALNIPFEITDQEQEIVLYQKSSFILGRSGTGKTAVLVMKLLQREQLHRIASEGFCEVNNDALVSGLRRYEAGVTRTAIRQIFVAVNLKLCVAVRQHISNLRRFANGENQGEGSKPFDLDDMDEDENFKDVPDTFVDIPPNIYPLVITFNIFLLMLDRTIGESYFDRFPDIRKINYMETANSRLVVQVLVRRKVVSYGKFRTSYWPHFDSQVTRKLESSRVFIEINSCIKGGLYSGQIDDSKLSLEKYLQLANRRVSNLDEEERRMIYKIFLDYEKMKMARGEFDLADLVNDLHCRLKRYKLEGDFMDFVYIDEVQDLTMKQVALFKYICRNVQDGFVFAGDTAQTIARGVDFRFENIRCLFYKEFLHGLEIAGENSKQEKGKISPIFQLSQNFRSHSGVLNLAQSVVNLIYHFFPHSIDYLNPETSLLRGEAPILLDCGSNGDAMINIFKNNANDSENISWFGSEQVILVRDDAARDEIHKTIGRHAIVLTIFECKGLEFQDVLLYNFFGTSPWKDQWRIIYDYMDRNLQCLTYPESSPSFTHSRHNVLCHELKQLYVAITRTRQRLWICEDSDGFTSPMLDYWEKLRIIQFRKFNDSYAREMQVASSSEDWRSRGSKMLEVRNYKIAAQCFERAGDCDWVTFARAAGLSEDAHNLRGLSLQKSLQMFGEAAKLFESIKSTKKAAECYFDAEDFENAGRMHYSKSNFQQAGQCFTLAGCFERAAKVYAEGYYLHECLYACSEGKLFDLGLCYIRSWKEQENLGKQKWITTIDLNASEQDFLHNCALASYKLHDKETMMKYVKDFSSLTSMRTFLRKLGCFHELIDLEIKLKHFFDAAQTAREMGNILLEADLLEKAGHYSDASMLYIAFVLATSLWANDSKGWPLKEFPSKEELLLKAEASACNCSDDFHTIICSKIQLLSDGKHDFQELQKKLAQSKRLHNLWGEILSVRKILDLLLETGISIYERGRDKVGNSNSHYNRWNQVNKVPLTTLMRYWNCWKNNVLNILKYLHSLKAKESSNYTKHGEFCSEYLGVRKWSNDPDAGYFLLYGDAKWVKSVSRRSDNMDSITTWQLVNAAQRYWCAELLSVGMKLLETLECLKNLAAKESLSKSCISHIFIYMFGAAQFLLDHCKFLEQTSYVWHSVMSYIDMSAEDYFAYSFALDRRTLLPKDSLIEFEASRNLLKEAICRRYLGLIVYGEGSTKNPTITQAIQVAVILLGSSMQISEHYMEMLSKMGSPWKPLFYDLVKRAKSDASTVPLDVIVVRHLHIALSDIYQSKSNWRQEWDHISPSCFIFLLDRLLLLVSCFNGLVLSTRSSVIEWLVHQDWNVNSDTFAAGNSEASFLMESVYEFLAQKVHELLLNKQYTEEWIKKAGFDLKKGFPLLMQKLMILMCLICLNSDKYKYLELLSDAFSKPELITFLPTSFQEVLLKRRGSSFRNVIAEALDKIGDPLVIIKSPEISSFMYVRHAIFLNVYNQSREKILERLFRRQH